MQNLKISIIGAGNLGTQLTKALYKSGFLINQVFSRSLKNAKPLAKITRAHAINTLDKLNNDTDLMIICVSDSAIEDVINQIHFQPKLIVHTAGSVALNVLDKFKNHGVFYPLQTFSKNISVNFKNVPVCIESNTINNLNTLTKIGNKISNSVFSLTSHERLQCHLAAVFANNFTNHMFAIAEQLLVKNHIPFDILRPIILETAKKVQKVTPRDAQTGPAVRNDVTTIQTHINLLDSQHLEKIYSFVSESIWDYKMGNLPSKYLEKKDE